MKLSPEDALFVFSYWGYFALKRLKKILSSFKKFNLMMIIGWIFLHHYLFSYID